MSSALRFIAATLAILVMARPAFAYIGPGAGLSVIAAFWALLTAVVSSILFLVLWPLRNRLRRRKAAGNVQREASEEAHRGSHADGRTR